MGTALAVRALVMPVGPVRKGGACGGPLSTGATGRYDGNDRSVRGDTGQFQYHGGLRRGITVLQLCSIAEMLGVDRLGHTPGGPTPRVLGAN